jgi:uncharacterized protein (TIGR01777 family)
LSDALIKERHSVVVLTRGNAQAASVGQPRRVRWTPDGGAGEWVAEIDDADAVVNLAGESIAARRWSRRQKERILDSRLRATASLVEAIRGARTPPSVLISGSAVGFYGPLGDQVVGEDHSPGADFLSHVCVKWEAEASRAESARTRVVLVRTGLVLDKNGGALPRMVLPFKVFAGGPIGSGRQYMPWIHWADWVGLVRWALVTTMATGAMNATAPSPVTNAEFVRSLGRSIGRPALLPAPGFALKLLLGEMAEGLLLTGQRAVPRKAQNLGFEFQHPVLDEALHSIFT